jgi:class 3 adenylate cyclase
MLLGAVTGRVHPPHGEEAERLADLARSLRRRMGDEEYERLAENGRRLGDNEVVDLALSRLTAPTGTTTLLFTDIVGSTQLVGAIGDEAWLELLEWHNRTLHELIGAHGGEVVDRTGDGYLAMFSSPLQAVAGAIAIQRTLRQHRRETGFAPRLRIGVHHGLVTYEDGSPRGLEVHLTARIVDAAQPDEILASAALADEFGIDISTRRKIDAKGIEFPVEVGTVSW